jgi:hypothetical protein
VISRHIKRYSRFLTRKCRKNGDEKSSSEKRLSKYEIDNHKLKAKEEEEEEEEEEYFFSRFILDLG